MRPQGAILSLSPWEEQQAVLTHCSVEVVSMGRDRRSEILWSETQILWPQLDSGVSDREWGGAEAGDIDGNAAAEDSEGQGRASL